MAMKERGQKKEERKRTEERGKKEDRPMAEKTEREKEKIVSKCITHWERYLFSAYDSSYGSRKTRR